MFCPRLYTQATSNGKSRHVPKLSGSSSKLDGEIFPLGFGS